MDDSTIQLLTAVGTALGTAAGSFVASSRGSKKGSADAGKSVETKVDALQAEMAAHRQEAQGTRVAVDGLAKDVHRLEGRVEEQGTTLRDQNRVLDATQAKIGAVHERLDAAGIPGRPAAPYTPAAIPNGTS
jgi:TolA-binding protein